MLQIRETWLFHTGHTSVLLVFKTRAVLPEGCLFLLGWRGKEEFCGSWRKREILDVFSFAFNIVNITHFQNA